MHKTQHTQKPWAIGTWGKHHSLAGHPQGIYTSEADEEDEEDICRICEIGAEGEDWANARLIRSAPKLLEACELVLLWDDGEGGPDLLQHAIEEIRTVVSEATDG